MSKTMHGQWKEYACHPGNWGKEYWGRRQYGGHSIGKNNGWFKRLTAKRERKQWKKEIDDGRLCEM